MNDHTTDIHGHEILYLVHEAPVPFTRDSLRAYVQNQFGPDARFCTCHGGGMTFDELLQFLLGRGKLVEKEGKIFTEMSQVCGHGDHHEH